jgi:4-hydroxythreonine-4-phosphate dehydrogenase
MLQERAKLLSIDITFKEYNKTVKKHIPGEINILPYAMQNQVRPGNPDSENAGYVLSTLDRAVDGCLSGEFAAMTTGPVNKAVINQAGIEFSGHTEYIAERCNHAFPVMMLASPKMKVILVTTHIPLASVAISITADRLKHVLSIVHHDLVKRFNIASPRLLLCGLNPHAGEEGYLGHEEQTIVNPIIDEFNKKGLNIRGPVAADTAFTPSSLQDTDAVICMYHDQGLPVLKSQGFGEIVNITLGLPIVRTSVDHGTALELAATGKASDSSLMAAVDYALKLSGTDN